jgi:hypothetical protein
MKKSESFDGYEWSEQPTYRAGTGTEKRRGRKGDGAVKETPEEMIRSLQGIFCTGRYRSWVFSIEERNATRR